MNKTYTIRISTEIMPDKRTAYIGVVKENKVSSFWYSESEALNMTIEALQWVLEVEEELVAEQRYKEELLKSIQKDTTTNNQYSITFPIVNTSNYASNIQMYWDRKISKKTVMVA